MEKTEQHKKLIKKVEKITFYFPTVLAEGKYLHIELILPKGTKETNKASIISKNIIPVVYEKNLQLLK